MDTNNLKKAIELAEKAGQELLKKSHVKAYSRTTASGASVQVKEHDDKRVKDAGEHANDLSTIAQKSGKAEDHKAAADAHHHAVKNCDAGDRDFHRDAAKEHEEKAKGADHEAKSHEKIAAGFEKLMQDHYGKGTKTGDAQAQKHKQSMNYHLHEAKRARGETDKENPHIGTDSYGNPK